jgi:hypothetical protein
MLRTAWKENSWEGGLAYVERAAQLRQAYRHTAFFPGHGNGTNGIREPRSSRWRLWRTGPVRNTAFPRAPPWLASAGRPFVRGRSISTPKSTRPCKNRFTSSCSKQTAAMQKDGFAATWPALVAATDGKRRGRLPVSGTSASKSHPGSGQQASGCSGGPRPDVVRFGRSSASSVARRGSSR